MLLHQRHYALVLRLDRRHRLNTSLRCRQSPSPVHLPRRCQIRREQVRVRARRSRIAPATPTAALGRPPRAGQSKARKMASCCTSRVCRLSRCDHPCRPARGGARRAGVSKGRARRGERRTQCRAAALPLIHIRPDSAVNQTQSDSDVNARASRYHYRAGWASSSRSTPSSTATDILLAAICAFRLLPNGFAHRDLRACLAPLLGLAAEAMTSGQISYDLHAPRGVPSYSRYSREELGRGFPKMLTEPRPGPGLALVHAVGSRRDRDEPGGHLADLGAFGLKAYLIQTWKLGSDPEFIGKAGDIWAFTSARRKGARVHVVGSTASISAHWRRIPAAWLRLPGHVPPGSRRLGVHLTGPGQDRGARARASSRARGRPPTGWR